MRPLSDALPSAAHAARALQMLGSHQSGTGTGTMEQKPLAPNDAILALDALAPDLPVSDAHLGARALQELCHGLAAKSGWWIDLETGEDVRTWPPKFFLLWVQAKLGLITSEVSEAVEGHRKGLQDDHLPHRSGIEVELADAIIRAMDLAGGLGLDVAGAIIEKLAVNQQRADHKIENRNAAGGKAV